MGRKNSIDIYSSSKKKRKKGKKGKVAAIVIIIALLLLILAAAWLWFFNRDLISGIFPEPATEPETAAVTTQEPSTEEVTELEYYTVERIEIPDVTGLAAKDAYDKLNAAGVRYTVVREYSETVKAEYILSQEPGAGEEIKADDIVTLHISKGIDHPEETTVAPSTSATDPTKSSDKEKNKKSESGSYILDGSDTRYIGKSEIEELDEDEMTLALNEIFARYGRKFKTPSIQAYFNKQSWYKGTIDPEDFDEDVISSVERANVNLILEVMSERGYR